MAKKKSTSKKTTRKTTKGSKSTKKKPSKKVTRKKSTKKKSSGKKSSNKKPTKKKSTGRKSTKKKSVKKKSKKKPTTTKKKSSKKTTKKKSKTSRKSTAKKTKSNGKAGHTKKAGSKPKKAPKVRKMGKRELNYYKKLLLLKRAELLGDISSMEKEALMSENSNLSHLPMHLADIGSDNYDQDLMLGLMESERKLLIEINEALERIDEGTYGICAETGVEIGKPRLEAKPWAKYCIEVARERERRGSNST